MIEFSVDTHNANKVATGIEPQGLASPDKPPDRIAVERFFFSVYGNHIVAAQLDLHVARRKRLEFRGRAVRHPIAQHQHLHSRRRIAGDEEKLLWRSALRPLISIANANFPVLELNQFINVGGTRGLAFDFEIFRCEIRGGAENSRERNSRSAINKLEIYLRR